MNETCERTEADAAVHRESWARAALSVLVESVLFGFLPHIGAVLLLAGAILATRSKLGIIVLLLGVLALFGFAMRGMASWSVWKRPLSWPAKVALWLACFGIPILIAAALCGVTAYAVFVVWP